MKNKNINAWEKISKDYAKIIVPNRPSPDDCSLYGKLINRSLRNKTVPKILVLGSTPELRRILYTSEFTKNAKVFCIDINSAMYSGMENFIMNSSHFNEKFIMGNWLDTKFKTDYFDLVVGDEIICNIPYDLHAILFNEIKRILKYNGNFITRHNFYIDADKRNSVKKILFELAQKIFTGEYDFQYAANLLYVKLFYLSGWKFPDNNSMQNHSKLAGKEFKSFKDHKLNKIIKELISIYDNNFAKMAGNYKWYLLSEKDSEKELKDHFTINSKVYAGDYFSVKNSPIYSLKKLYGKK